MAVTLNQEQIEHIPKQICESWIPATWEEFLALCAEPIYANAKFYYLFGSYRIQMGVGADHGTVNSLIDFLINLFCMVNQIPVKSFANTSYRKNGVSECQPDSSYYIGESVAEAPQGSSIVNMDDRLPPNLEIEVADSSLADDLGMKRILYEEAAVQEYWVVDVQKLEIIAFAILSNVGSERIQVSRVLQGLSITIVEEALHKSREMDNSQIGTWFMAQWRSQ